MWFYCRYYRKNYNGRTSEIFPKLFIIVIIRRFDSFFFSYFCLLFIQHRLVSYIIDNVYDYFFFQTSCKRNTKNFPFFFEMGGGGEKTPHRFVNVIKHFCNSCDLAQLTPL